MTTWQPLDATRGDFLSGYHSAVASADGTSGFIFWMENVGTGYDTTSKVRLRGRTVSLDGTNTLGTPFNTGWETTGNGYPETEYWHTLLLSDDRIVMTFDVVTSAGHENMVLLLDTDGTLLDDFLVSSSYRPNGGAAVSPGDVLFVNYNSYLLRSFSFGGGTITAVDTATLGASSVHNSFGMLIADGSYVYLFNNHSGDGWYRRWNQTGGTMSADTGWLALPATADYPGKNYAVISTGSQRATPAVTPGQWIINGYVVNEDGAGNEYPSTALISMPSGVPQIDELHKWDTPAGAAVPFTRFWAVTNATDYRIYPMSYVQSLPIWAARVGDVPTAFYSRMGPFATPTDVVVQRFPDIASPGSDLSATFSYDQSSDYAVPGLTDTHIGLAMTPIGGPAGTLIVGMWGFLDVGTTSNIGFLQWIPVPATPPVPTADPEPSLIYIAPQDAEGNLARSGTISVFKTGTSTPTSTPLFLDRGMTTPVPPTFDAAPVAINLWAEHPDRVDILVETNDLGTFLLSGVDFEPSPHEAVHGTRVQISSVGWLPDSPLTITEPGGASFVADDLAVGHAHKARTGAVSLATVGFDPRSSAPHVIPADDIGLDLRATERRAYTPEQSPGSVLLSPVGVNGDLPVVWWPESLTDPNEPFLDQHGQWLHGRFLTDPASLGENVVAGTRIRLLGSRNVLVGYRMTMPDAFFQIPTFDHRTVALGEEIWTGVEGVAIGQRVFSIEDSNNDHTPSSGTVAIGQRLINNYVDDYGSSVFIGSADFNALQSQYDGTPMSVMAYRFQSGVLLGRLSGMFPGTTPTSSNTWYYWLNNQTLLALGDGYPAGSITDDVDNAPFWSTRHNDGWLFWRAYSRQRDLGGDRRSSFEAGFIAASPAVIARKTDALPVGTGDQRWTALSFGGHNIVPHNIRSYMPPITLRSSEADGLVLITLPKTRVPGPTTLAGDVTLSAPKHDAVGGTASKTGFFGSAGTVRPVVTPAGGNAALTSLLDALSSLGLVSNPGDTLVSDTLQERLSRILDNADTGQAPVGFESEGGCISATLTGAQITTENVLAGTGSIPEFDWQPALYYTDRFDVVVEATFVAWGTDTNDGLLLRAIPDDVGWSGWDSQPSSGPNLWGQCFEFGLLAARDGLYLRNSDGTRTLIASYSTAAVDGDTLSVQGIARAITVKVNGATVLTHTRPDDVGGLMHGFAVSRGGVVADFSVRIA